MQSKQRWQDWVILALGAWLFLAPFFVGYTSLSGPAAWNSYVLGAVVAVFAVAALWRPESPSEEWVNLVLGLWLVIAPFALGFFATETIAAWNQVVVGVLVAGDSIWAIVAQSKTSESVPHH